MSFKLVVLLTAVVLGPVLYRIRSRQPFYYGIGEFLVGAGVVYVLLFPTEMSFLLLAEPHHSALTDFASLPIGILGGIYVMVRGLDNMDRGLPTRVRPFWDLAFPKRGPTLS